MALKIDGQNLTPTWVEIVTPADLDAIMEQFGSFHDSCLRDVHLSTTAFVNQKLAMSFDNEVVAVLLFQRQCNANPVLELKFVDLVGLNYQPPPKNYTEVIDEAVLKMVDGIYYWADHKEWTLSGVQDGDVESVWIGGRKLYYRWRPELLGNITRFPE